MAVAEALVRRGRPPRIRATDVLAAVGRRSDPDWTMAAIAADLGVSDAALYYYFPTKQSLLRAFGDAVIDGVRLPPCDGDWLAWLRAIAVELYDTVLRYPALVERGVAVPAGTGASNLRLMEGILDTLVGCGVDVATAGEGLVLVLNLTWTSAGAALRPLLPSGEQDQLQAAAVGEGLPNTTALARHLFGRTPRALFETALDTTLAGIRATSHTKDRCP